jgi:hypothetical protein
MDPLLLEGPYLSSILQFPAIVTGVFRHGDGINAFMKRLFGIICRSRCANRFT